MRKSKPKGIEVKITGTIAELTQLWNWDKVSEMIHVDYYKCSMVPTDEKFTITEADLIRVDIIEG